MDVGYSTMFHPPAQRGPAWGVKQIPERLVWSDIFLRTPHCVSQSSVGRWLPGAMDVQDHLEGIPLQVRFVLDPPPDAGLRVMGVVQQRWVGGLWMVLHQPDRHVLGMLHQSRRRRGRAVVVQMLRRLVVRLLLVVLLFANDLLDLLSRLLPLVHFLQQDFSHEGHPIEVLPCGAKALMGVLGVALLLELVHIALFNDRPAGLHEGCKDVWFMCYFEARLSLRDILKVLIAQFKTIILDKKPLTRRKTHLDGRLLPHSRSSTLALSFFATLASRPQRRTRLDGIDDPATHAVVQRARTPQLPRWRGHSLTCHRSRGRHQSCEGGVRHPMSVGRRSHEVWQLGGGGRGISLEPAEAATGTPASVGGAWQRRCSGGFPLPAGLRSTGRRMGRGIRGSTATTSWLGAHDLGHRYVVHKGHGLKVFPLGVEAILV